MPSLEQVKQGAELIETIKKYGVSASQALLVAAIGYAQFRYLDWSRAHWRWLLAGVVAYEALIFILLPIPGFIGELWERHFKANALSATASWLNTLSLRYLPGFNRRYRTQVRLDHEVFNMRGLGLIGAHLLKLEKVFVDLKISATSNPEKLNPDPVAARQFANAHSLWDFLRASKGVSANAIALAIVGPPGCGKTTLLQYVAVTLATNRQLRFHVRAYTPILLFLRDQVAAITANPAITLGELAQRYFSNAQRYPNLNPPTGWFQRQLADYACLVLLDGLDEVADIDKRVTVSAWIDQQIRYYPRSRFIVTSRPQNYTSAPLTRANIVEVQNFTSAQVRCFVNRWYLAEEIASSGNQLDEGVRQQAYRNAQDLLRRLAEPQSPALNELSVNPLLLTMISLVHRYRGALPGNRVELYREIIEVLLGRWRQSRGVAESLTADQKRFVLMPLAEHMMENYSREISTVAALKVLKPFLTRVGLSENRVDTFLTDIQMSSGLLLEREQGRWSFAHIVFQEYLTAAHWLYEKNEKPTWNDYIESNWWRETLLLYASMSDATHILKDCLTIGSDQAMSLAKSLIEGGGREVRADVRQAVVEKLSITPRLELIVGYSGLLDLADENKRKLSHLSSASSAIAISLLYELSLNRFFDKTLLQDLARYSAEWIAKVFELIVLIESNAITDGDSKIFKNQLVNFLQSLTIRLKRDPHLRLELNLETSWYHACETDMDWCLVSATGDQISRAIIVSFARSLVLSFSEFPQNRANPSFRRYARFIEDLERLVEENKISLAKEILHNALLGIENENAHGEMSSSLFLIYKCILIAEADTPMLAYCKLRDFVVDVLRYSINGVPRLANEFAEHYRDETSLWMSNPSNAEDIQSVIEWLKLSD